MVEKGKNKDDLKIKKRNNKVIRVDVDDDDDGGDSDLEKKSNRKSTGLIGGLLGVLFLWIMFGKKSDSSLFDENGNLLDGSSNNGMLGMQFKKGESHDVDYYNGHHPEVDKKEIIASHDDTQLNQVEDMGDSVPPELEFTQPWHINLGEEKGKQKVLEFESQIFPWAQSNIKYSVYIFGERARLMYTKDTNVYHKAFKQHGFTLVKAPNDNPVDDFRDTKAWALLCPALNTDMCFQRKSSRQRVPPYLKVNNIPQIRQIIWSKNAFHNAIKSGTKGLDIFSNLTIKSWLYPEEYDDALKYAKKHPRDSFIIKRVDSGMGRGIHVVDGYRGLRDIKSVDKNPNLIIERYLNNPHLINHRKWDIRSYVILLSSAPARCYFYHRGLVRFATSKYNKKAKNGGDKTQFLTNVSVNKKNVDGSVSEITWAFSHLKEYFEKHGEDYELMIERMQASVSLVFLSSELIWMKKKIKEKNEHAYGYRIFGVDLIVDEHLNPRVLEVNSRPSLMLSEDVNDHYTQTKLKMVYDAIGMMYDNKKSVVDELFARLEEFNKPEMIKLLTQTDWRYLLEYVSESRFRGDWLSAYPNYKAGSLQRKLLLLHQNQPSRVALHDIITFLDKKRVEDGGL